jgi:dihydrodipicolinate synthase/N-acetylneuraminate lyase
MTRQQPWHGVLVATALPFRDDLSVDLDRYGEHVRWLAENGCHGVVPNGSLGEYQVLTPDERAAVVRTAVEAAPSGFSVVPGIGAYGALESRRWAEQAAELGCPAVLALPPNAYRAEESAVLGHYRELSGAGIPVVAYNNPFDTKVDLTPEVLARLFHEGLIVAVKEFSGDVRRSYQLAELAPGLDLLVGADDVLVELALGGAVGWVAGFPNSLPRQCVALYEASLADPGGAVPAYRRLHSLLRWDSRPAFVQAIKVSMDVAGRYGGACRPPREPLASEHVAAITKATEEALA